MSPAQGPGDSLSTMLSVERVGDDDFVAHLEDFWGGTAGADLVARSVLAASQTVDGRTLHSLHAVYLAPLPSRVPLALRVDRLDDTPALSRRGVRVCRDGRLLCSVTASFCEAMKGLTYQGARLDSDLASPETLPSTLERAQEEGWADFASGPIEFRRIGVAWPWPPAPANSSTIHREWVRPRRPLPNDPSIQSAALAFLSDFYSHWTASDRLGSSFVPQRFRPIDHALWIHRTLSWNTWWLLKVVSEVGSAGPRIERYSSGEAGPEEAVKRADFTMGGHDLICIDP